MKPDLSGVRLRFFVGTPYGLCETRIDLGGTARVIAFVTRVSSRAYASPVPAGHLTDRCDVDWESRAENEPPVMELAYGFGFCPIALQCPRSD